MNIYRKLLPGLTSMLLMSTVFFLAPMANVAALGDKVFVVRLIQAVMFNLIWAACLPYALLVLPVMAARGVVLLLSAMTVIFSAFSVLHLKLYGQLIAAPSVSALLDTNQSEASEFIAISSSPSNIAVVLFTLAITTALAIVLYRSLKSLKTMNIPKLIAWICLAMVIILTIAGWSRVTFSLKNPFTFYVQTGYEVLSNRSGYERMINLHPQPSGAVLNDPEVRATHIIIIGESATPSHMSIYGYGRLTDVFESESVKDNDAAMKFYFSRDACSSQPNTQLSLSDVMLAERKLEGSSATAAPSNMISIFKDAGFKVYWISNQSGGAGNFSLGSVWGHFADKPEFLNKKDFREGYDFDEVLLPALQKALNDSVPRKVIFLHLLGSHPDYKQRYPNNFVKWDLTSDVPESVPRRSERNFDRASYNAYDNSLAYTDYVLSKVVGMGARLGALTITYFSDHGNNLGEKSTLIGHSLVTGPRQGYEIPIFFWVYRGYVEKKPKIFEYLDVNLKKPVSLDRIQYSLFDLYGINLNNSDPTQSLFSNKFVLTHRRCDSFQ